MATVTRARFLHGREISRTNDQLTATLSFKVWKEVDGVLAEMTYTEILSALATQDVAQNGPHPDPDLAHLKCRGFTNNTPSGIFANEITAHFEIPDLATQPDNIDQFLQRSNTVGDRLGPSFDWDSMIVQEYWPTDLEGKPWLNTAKDPIQPDPIDVPIAIGRVTVNRLAKPNPDNSQTAQGRLLLFSETGRNEFHTNKESGVETMYHAVTWTVWKHPFRDWKKKERLNVGYRELAPDLQNGGNKRVPIRDHDTGEPVNAPALLRENGQEWHPDGGDAIHILEFTVKLEGTINVPYLSHLF